MSNTLHDKIESLIRKYDGDAKTAAGEIVNALDELVSKACDDVAIFTASLFRLRYPPSKASTPGEIAARMVVSAVKPRASEDA